MNVYNECPVLRTFYLLAQTVLDVDVQSHRLRLQNKEKWWLPFFFFPITQK